MIEIWDASRDRCSLCLVLIIAISDIFRIDIVVDVDANWFIGGGLGCSSATIH